MRYSGLYSKMYSKVSADRVADAIHGHAGKTAADNYGDVTLKTKVDALSKMPTHFLWQ